jgi:DNA-binding transcriptional MerR regulator
MKTKGEQPEDFSLAELAERAAVSPRTIRFYIARGLLSGPRKAGRGASYGEEHLAKIREILALQSQGLTLAEIETRFSGGFSDPVVPAPASWHCYSLDEDVTVNVRAGVAPWKQKQVQRFLGELAHYLSQTKSKEKEKDHES